MKCSKCIFYTVFILVPIPTYILGPNKEDHLSLYPVNESDCELCPNVYYLGKKFLNSC